MEKEKSKIERNLIEARETVTPGRDFYLDFGEGAEKIYDDAEKKIAEGENLKNKVEKLLTYLESEKVISRCGKQKRYVSTIGCIFIRNCAKDDTEDDNSVPREENSKIITDFVKYSGVIKDRTLLLGRDDRTV